jgi:hypothetical protein
MAAPRGRDGGAGGIAGDGGDGGSASSNGGAGGSGFGGDGGDIAIAITNNGSVVTSGAYSHGIYALARGGRGAGGNGGNGGAGATGDGGDGGSASADGGDGGAGFGADGGDIAIVNTGDVHTSGFSAHGIYAKTIAGYGTNGVAGSNGASTSGTNGAGGNGGIGGLATANGGAGGAGFGGDSGSIDIENSGWVVASGDAVRAVVDGGSGTVQIVNSGTLFGGGTSHFFNNYGAYTTFVGSGIYSNTPTTTTITNSGYLGAASVRAIQTRGGPTTIVNKGLITDFVDLTDNPDTFINQAGGVFETKLISDFGPGDDLFRNEAGGTVQAATDPTAHERSSFVNLERFENGGLITMRDGQEGDSFEISNTVGGRDLKFIGSGDSALGVERQGDGRRVLFEAPDRHRLLRLRPVLPTDGKRRVRAEELPRCRGLRAAAADHRRPGHVARGLGHLVRPQHRSQGAAEWRRRTCRRPRSQNMPKPTPKARPISPRRYGCGAPVTGSTATTAST